jgi:hypothetical protein
LAFFQLFSLKIDHPFWTNFEATNDGSTAAWELQRAFHEACCVVFSAFQKDFQKPLIAPKQL